MDQIWFEEELFPDPAALEEFVQKGKPAQPLEKVSRVVRIHMPREKVLSPAQAAKLALAKPGHRYVLLRLGCEFERVEQDGAAEAGFSSALCSVYLWGTGQLQPRVYDLWPDCLDSGKPGAVRIKFEPTITIDPIGVGLGGIEKDLEVGEVAPIVRGFAGQDERQPYWKLVSHREAPLFGLRHFWLLVESPPGLDHFSIVSQVEGVLKTRWGRLLLKPKQTAVVHRPRHRIDL